MALTRQDLEQLIQRPRESLDTELKQWIDPATPEGRAIVVRACLALRNNNGGCLIIGIRDDGKPDPFGPADVHSMFHGDVIQQIVGDFASQPFAVDVEYIERDGVTYPVVCVPSGIETPVVAKRELPNPVPKKPALVKCDAVYVRTVNSNNTVSSSPARAADWPQLVRHCFDNREADIGAFIRRHLPGLNLSHLAGQLTPAAPIPTASELALQLLNAGRTRFAEVIAQRRIAMPSVGAIEVAVIVDGLVPNHLADQQLLFRLQANRRDLTGWPFWVSLQGSNDQNLWPYHFNGGWECLIAELDQADAWGTHLDFWRIEPTGRFYHLRALEDDMHHPRSQRPTPGTQLDFYLVASRVTEIISYVLSFARTLGCNEQSTALELAFRWSGLNGRALASWVVPGRRLRGPGSLSHQDSVTTQARIPLETPSAGLVPYVSTIVAPVYALFGGRSFEPEVIEGIVNETVNRRM